MSISIKTPPSLAKCSSYETWLKEIKIWQSFTDLDAKKQGPAIFLTLEGRAREAVLELDVASISANDGVKKITEKLDTLFLKDKTQSAFEAYDTFEKFRRSSDMSVSDYINEFERLKAKVESYKMVLSTDIMAYRLLKSANLSESHEQLAKATIPNLTYEDMKAQLKKIFGDVSQSASNSCQLGAVKPEPAFYQSNARGKFSKANQNFQSENWNKKKNWKGKSFRQVKPTRQGRNPLNKNGEVSRCDICDSINHWASNCPDAVYYQDSGSSDGSAEDAHEITLFQSNLVMNEQFNIFVTETLNTAVLDSGATANVAGKIWTRCYLDSLSEGDRSDVTYSDSQRSFKFGSDHIFSSLHKVRFPATIGSKRLFIETDVIDTNLPLLLSKEAMKTAETKINFEDDSVVMFGKKQDVIVTRSGHYSVPLDNKQKILEDAASNTTKIVLHITEANAGKKKIASKLHSQFAHPDPEKLIKLVSAAGMGNDLDLIKAIKDISRKCDVCQVYRKSRVKPIVSMPLANQFNEVVALDLKFYKGKIILHLIDHVSRFSAAAVVKSKNPNEIISKKFQCWISVFGPPSRYFHDNGGEFVNSEFIELCESFNITVLTTAAESPWSNGLCERHNAVLADMLDKIIEERQCDLETALCWAVNAKNSLSNVHGFSPYQLAIGYSPKMPCVLENWPPANESTSNEIVLRNLKSIESSRKAFIEAESKEKIKRALKSNLRTCNDQKFVSGDIVFYKRNDSKKWKGPAKVLGTDSQQVLLKHGGTYVRVHKCRLMLKDIPYQSMQGEEEQDLNIGKKTEETRDYNMNSENEEEKQSVTSHPADNDVESSSGDSTEEEDFQSPAELISDEEPKKQHSEESLACIKRGTEIKYRNKNEDEWKTAKVINRAGKATGKYKNCWNIRDHDSGDVKEIDTGVIEWKNVENPHETEFNLCETYLSEVDKVTEAAKLQELESWKREEVYEIVDDVGQETISVRWVITPKIVDGVTTTKARLVARGFQENVENIRTDSPTCMKESLRLLLSIASSKDWKINSIDIKVAFLQGKQIDREVFLKPPKEGNCQGKLWKLRKAVYGLSDASRVWYLRVVDELKRLGASVSAYDKAFFIWNDGTLQGLIAVHVDDFIWCGTSKFQKKIIDPIRESFKISKENTEAFRYLGVYLRQFPGELFLDQCSYVDSLKPISLPKSVDKNGEVDPSTKTCFKGLIGQLTWATSTSRPDLSYDTCFLSTQQVKPTYKSVFDANKALRELKNNQVVLKFPKLDLTSTKFVVYCDASYGNLPDGSSQGGHIVFLKDKMGNCSPISWSSKKLKRVVRSTLSAETVAAVDSLDTAYMINNMFSEIFPDLSTLQIEIHTDSKSLYDIVRTTNLPEDKRLRIDLSSLRESQDREKVSFRWTDSENQLADALTKKGASKKLLRDVLDSACLEE